MSIINIEFPWPPTINSYLIRKRGSICLSGKALAFKWNVKLRKPVGFKTIESKMHLIVECFPPDHRKRDISNIIKILEDAMQDAGYFTNDYNVDKLTVTRREVIKPGKVIVTIEEIPC